jgi:hypothetical protein
VPDPVVFGAHPTTLRIRVGYKLAEGGLMRRIFGTALILIFFATLASAQAPSLGNIFAGYSYYNTNLGAERQSLNGWQGSVEGKFFLPFIGIVGDVSANYGNLRFPICPVIPVGVPAGPCASIGVNSHIGNFLIGPRVSITVGKVRPFAEALFGAAHVSTSGLGSDTSFSTGVGGGIDYYLVHVLGVRVEADYLHSNLFNNPQQNVRISTGIVLRL